MRLVECTTPQRVIKRFCLLQVQQNRYNNIHLCNFTGNLSEVQISFARSCIHIWIFIMHKPYLFTEKPLFFRYIFGVYRKIRLC